MAGKIGTSDQVKITAFGPVVNLASRLESITKTVHAPILLDECTAQVLRGDSTFLAGRLRRVARVRPWGIATAVEISELLPPMSDEADLTNDQLAQYEAALDSILAGDWKHGSKLLNELPASDCVKEFLNSYMAQHQHIPPADWNGVIALREK